MEDLNKRRRISFFLSKPEKSTSGKFAYTCHFQQIGINATKIEKTGIHLKTDVFAAVAVVDAISSLITSRQRLATYENGMATKFDPFGASMINRSKSFLLFLVRN